MPASETVDFEREFEELVRELRALPADAPAEVRERVRALGEPEPRRVFAQLTWRRAVVVLVPACVVGVVAAAVVHGLLVSSSGSKQSAGSVGHVRRGGAVKSHARAGVTGSTSLRGVTTKTPAFDQTLTSSATPAPTPGRY